GFSLTDEQQVMLELIADGPVLAVPELEPVTAPLLATRLIALTDEAKWQITRLGEVMLEKRRHRLHLANLSASVSKLVQRFVDNGRSWTKEEKRTLAELVRWRRTVFVQRRYALFL